LALDVTATNREKFRWTAPEVLRVSKVLFINVLLYYNPGFYSYE
jgi:hypothetical protein